MESPEESDTETVQKTITRLMARCSLAEGAPPLGALRFKPSPRSIERGSDERSKTYVRDRIGRATNPHNTLLFFAHSTEPRSANARRIRAAFY
jgi:hypothetical protein